MSQRIPLTDWQAATTPAELPHHVRRNIGPGENGCWEWLRSKSRDGYGWASLNNKTYQAHRLVYRLTVGDPGGLVIDHICRNRSCVNPAHMEPVTPTQNLLRSPITPAGRLACLKCGGKFSTVGKKTPQRRCKDCARHWRRQYAREYRAGLRRKS